MEPAVLLLLIIAGIIFYFVRSNQRRNELRQARENYHLALDELKFNPTNPDVRQNTLQLGRHYSNLTRDMQGVTIFDEMALMNDINAACAGTAVSKPLPKIATSSPIEDRLNKLTELKRKGLVDEQEYASRRQKILDEI